MTRLRQNRPGAVGRVTATALLAAAATVPAVAVPAEAAPVPAEVPAAVAARQPVATQRTDAIRDDQWQLAELDAAAAWRVSTGSGVTVAVIDSGVDGAQPDLAGQVLPGIDLVSPGGDGQSDPVGHGTTVATLIAGRNDDAQGAVGLAPHARILPVRVLDEENRYDDALIVAQGVRWAVDHGARVINLSLGGDGDSPQLAAALDYAFARDVVVVACTGNVATSTGNRVWYPAREPGVVAVTGLDGGTDNLWSGAMTGPETALAAPSTGLVGARPGGYWRVRGTSFAAPLVTATAALLRARWPQMSAADVVNRLLRTARDLGPPGRDDQFGYGLVDPVAALRADVPTVARNPLDDQTSPGVAGFGAAPGLTAEAAAAPPAQAGAGSGGRWAVRPAGDADQHDPARFWVAVGLLVALTTGALLVFRRFNRGDSA